MIELMLYLSGFCLWVVAITICIGSARKLMRARQDLDRVKKTIHMELINLQDRTDTLEREIHEAIQKRIVTEEDMLVVKMRLRDLEEELNRRINTIAY